MKRLFITPVLLGAILGTMTLSSGLAVASSQAAGKVNVTETFNTPSLSANETVSEHKKAKVDIAKFEGKTGEQLRITAHIDYWFYDAWVTLYNDMDYDGYYSSFTLEFDADTNYYRAPVYAVVYLGTNDYYEPYYVTSVFDLYGDSSEDSVILENELTTGFPSNDYDILIELFDAQTDQHLATIDAYNDADLSYQSLESADYDYPASSEVVVEYHAGSWGIVSSAALITLVLIRRLQRK